MSHFTKENNFFLQDCSMCPTKSGHQPCNCTRLLLFLFPVKPLSSPCSGRHFLSPRCNCLNKVPIPLQFARWNIFWKFNSVFPAIPGWVLLHEENFWGAFWNAPQSQPREGKRESFIPHEQELVYTAVIPPHNCMVQAWAWTGFKRCFIPQPQRSTGVGSPRLRVQPRARHCQAPTVRNWERLLQHDLVTLVEVAMKGEAERIWSDAKEVPACVRLVGCFSHLPVFLERDTWPS